MKKQPYPVAQLTGGVVTDLDATFLVDQNSPYLRGVRFENGLIKKAYGRGTFGSGLPLTGANDSITAVLAIIPFTTSGGTKNTLVITEDYIYLYDPSAGTYSNKNREANAAPVALTGDLDDRVGWAVMGMASGGSWYDYLFVTNGVDDIQQWDGGAGKFANATGWTAAAIKAKQLVAYQSHLVAGFTIESGTTCAFRIRWSATGTPVDVTGVGSGFVDLVETPDWVVALRPVRGKLFVIKEKSIWELVYVGGTDIFKPVIRVNGTGSKSPDCIFSVGDDIALVTNNGIYLYDGVTLTPLSAPIHSYLYTPEVKMINENMIGRAVGMYRDVARQATFILPKKDSVYPNIEFTYYFDSGAWAVRDREITAFGEYTETSRNTWANGTGTWANQTGVWLSQNIPAGANTTLQGTAGGYVYEDDGLTKSNETLEFQTKDWIFEHAHRWTELRVQARGGPFHLAYSLDEGYTWQGSTYLSASNIANEFKEYVVWINKTSQKLRVRITSTANDLEVKWIEPWYVPRTRSISLISS